jgi:elongation factor Ts
MEIDAGKVKELREATGAGMMECKKALTETKGDFQKAIDVLRLKGVSKAREKQARQIKEGTIYAYVHPGSKIASLVELNCETDFAAKNEGFQELAKDIAMHVAAMCPKYLAPKDVPENELEREKKILAEQAKASGKPENVIAKMVEGRLGKFYEEICLLEQPFVKEPAKKIKDLITEKIAKIGENITLSRFVRYKVGEMLAANVVKEEPAAGKSLTEGK